MTIFILTLTWNGMDHLEKLYPTLKEATSKLPIESFWMLRDNASEDQTDELVDSWNDPEFVHYYQMDNNKDNFAKGNNYLVNKAEEDLVIEWDKDYFLLCNNDITIADPYSLRYMYDIMEKDEDVGIVGARLLYPTVEGSKRLLQHCGVIFSPKYAYNPFHYRWQEYDDEHSRKNREFQSVTGAFMLIRADCYRKTKAEGLDEKYFWCFEDICMNLDVNILQKKKVVYCGKTNIIHHESISLKKNNINRKFMKHNVALYQKMWRKKINVDHYNYLNDRDFRLYTK